MQNKTEMLVVSDSEPLITSFFSGLISYYLSAATMNINKSCGRNGMVLTGKNSDKLR